jgi:transketolase
MRNALTEALCRIAAKDERFLFLVADIGNITFDQFRKEHPDRFFNLGVAEANMVGVAAGLALSGKVPFVYTIASFLTMRAFEQIRDDVCYQNVNVKIVGVGGGVAYSNLGPTHHTVEDIAMMRAIPNMTIVAPADPLEAEKVSYAVCDHDGPVYIRLNKAGEPNLYTEDYDFVLGQATTLREGTDITLIATGAINQKAFAAADMLLAEGVSARVVNMHTLKPIDRDAILRAATETKAILTIEEHSCMGGLGGAVAEVLAQDAATNVPFRILGLPDAFAHEYGDQEFLTARLGLGTNDVVAAAQDLLK